MKRALLIIAVLAAALAFAAPAEAGHGCYSGIWNHGHVVHGVHSPYVVGYPAIHSTWHDTSHYDWHPGRFVWHGNHFDYIPGHWDYHQTGHWDTHLHH